MSDGGRVVTLTNGHRQVVRRYDRDQRLVEVQDGAIKYLVSYEPDGRRSPVERLLPSGRRVLAEIASDGRVAALIDSRGLRSEVRVDESGRPLALIVGDHGLAFYRYSRGRLTAIEYDHGATDHFSYDEQGRILEYRRMTGNPRVGLAAVRFLY
jgi:YD repeat-containing protein